MREVDLHLERRRPLCPYCHEVVSGGFVWLCPGCEAAHHAECQAELEACASCQLAGPVTSSPKETHRQARPSGVRQGEQQVEQGSRGWWESWRWAWKI